MDAPPGIPETAWLVDIHDGTQIKTTWANYHDGDVPPRTVGDSGSWVLQFERGGPRGEDDPLEHTDRYQDLVEIGRRAGDYVLHEPIEADPVYTEQIPPGSPSLLVGLRPTYPTITPGVWGLVDGISETNQLPQAYLQVTIDVTMLAPLDAYDDRTAVEDALSF